MARRTYRFEGFELDESAYGLRRAGAVIPLEPKVFEVLVYLVRHRDRMVSKDELLRSLWPDVFVSESVLPTNVTALRKALGDDRSQQRVIQTVYGRGYRFVAKVQVGGSGGEGEVSAATTSTTEDPTAIPEPRRSPFVGRAEAMAELRGALDAARTGHPQLVLLAGEPGIGKTRCAEELATHARELGVRVLAGRSHEDEGVPAYWPWLQILGESFRERATESEGERFQLFAAVARYLEHEGQREPLLIFLDDIHWADKSSLLLLLFLTRELAEARILLLCAYRDSELDRRHPLAQILGELTREPHCRRVPLRGLSREDVARLLGELTREAPDGVFVSSLHEMTEGNPFFLGEIVRWLASEGALTAEALPALRLPEGVREAIGRRLDALSPECSELLSAASVLGREFDFSLLYRVVDLDDSALLDLLDEARSGRIVEEAAGAIARFRFSHALIRETLYSELALPRRIALHRRVGETLEELHVEDPTPRLAELAHHFFLAAPGGDVARAVDYGRRAARMSVEGLAFEEGAAQLERVVQLLDLEPVGDELQRCEVLLELGDAYGRAAERDKGRAVFLRVAASARRLERWDFLARAAVGFGMRGEYGAPSDEPLRLLLEEALEKLDEDESALHAHLLARLSGTDPYSIRSDRSVPMATQAVELARRSGDRETLVACMAARCSALHGLDDPEVLFAAGTELLEMGRELVRDNAPLLGKQTQVSARQARYNARLVEGDIAAARGELLEMDALAAEVRDPMNSWFLSWHHIGQAIAQGRFSDAERWIEKSRRQAERLQLPRAPRLPELLRLFLRREQGVAAGEAEREALVGYLERLARSPLFSWPMRVVAARYFVGLGLEERARRLFEELSAHDYEDHPRDSFWMLDCALLTELCAHFEDRQRAERLWEALRPHADRNLCLGSLRIYLGSTHHFLGLLAATLGRREAADGHFEAALRQNERMGSHAHAARTRLEWGALLVGRDAPAHRAKGLELLGECASRAEALGMADVLARANALRS